MRRFILASAVLLACLATASGTSGAAAGSKKTTAAVRLTTTAAKQRTAAIRWLSGRVYAYQRATWRWERLMGTPMTPTAGRVLAKMSVPDVKRAVRMWRRRAHHARRRASNPPHLQAFLCIHHYEGSWTDGSGPYYGGLQMDLGFQEHYAPQLLQAKGTADHWTPLEQIWAAEKAAKSRGFYPWPNTARVCGLI